MHTNHRRKKPRHHKVKAEGGGRYGGILAYSLAWWKREFWQSERARVRDLIVNEREDEIPTHYPRSILWNYF